MMPQLVGDGIVVAGDAAGFCCAKGPNLEGINLAAHSGTLAGEAVIEARAANDHSARTLAGYRRRLEESFVPPPPGSEELPPRSQAARDRPAVRGLPELICDFMDRMYRIDGKPKDGLVDMGLGMARKRVGA